MAKTTKRPIAVFKNPKKIDAFLVKARAIVERMGNYTLVFVTPSPSLADVTDDLDALQQAESNLLAGTGTLEERDLAYTVALKDINQLLSYVQTEADKKTDPVEAADVIDKSGFVIRGFTPHAKPLLKAKMGKVAGIVILIAKASNDAAKASYEWQQSTDGTSWQYLSSTTKARTETESLAEGKYYFRFRVITSKSKSEWSESVHIMVPGWLPDSPSPDEESYELREDGGLELREDGGVELREG